MVAAVILIVIANVPTQVAGGGFLDGGGDAGKIGGHVMLKSPFADEMQQALQLWDLHHARASEGVQRVVG